VTPIASWDVSLVNYLLRDAKKRRTRTAHEQALNVQNKAVAK
jgi:hypothetical protein